MTAKDWKKVLGHIALALFVFNFLGAFRSGPIDPARAEDTRTAWERWCDTTDIKSLPGWQQEWVGRPALGIHRVWTTNCGPQKGLRDGDYHIACSQLPPGTVVWLSKNKQLKIITNKGEAKNDIIAKRRGAHFWAGRQSTKPRRNNTCQDLYIIGRVPQKG